MMSTIEKFKNYLINIKYPKQFEGWHIQGILKQNSNEVYKFDVSNLVKETDLNFQNQQSFYTESTTNESKKKQINLEPIISAFGGVWLIIFILFS